MDHLIPEVIHNFHVEWTHGSAAVPSTAIIVFNSIVYFLTNTILYCVLVIGLEAHECLQQLHFLVNQEPINHRKVFQAGWTVAEPLRNAHPSTWWHLRSWLLNYRSITWLWVARLGISWLWVTRLRLGVPRSEPLL